MNARWKVSSQRGFALIVTVVLLAFLVVLAVAIGSLTKISGSFSEVTAQQSDARQNALLALDLAVAQLQKFVGPDTRLTASADYLGDAAQLHFTGVWDGTTGAQPLTWLVSGNEGINPLAVSPSRSPGNAVVMLGTRSVGAGNRDDRVAVPLVDLAVEGIPGQPTGAVTGRYAWWIADQGVKASLALPDHSLKLAYPPYDIPEMLLRLRSQLARGPSCFAVDPPNGFDPQLDANAALLDGLIAPAQIAQLTPAESVSLPQFLQATFHHFTAQTWGVLANTRTDDSRGLKLDLSLDPAQLGPAFAAFANYPGYMEPTSAGLGLIPPITGDQSLRRRYRIQPPVANVDPSVPPFVFGVAPVLTDFLLQFSIQRAGPQVQIKSRMYVALWNPCTSALVPEPLRIEIAGLPTVLVQDQAGTGSLGVNLQSAFGGATSPPCAVNLPFAGTTNDTLSWLPGRLYSWTTQTGTAPSADLHFYDKNISATGWQFATTIAGTAHLAASVSSATRLTVTLTRADRAVLATYQSPTYPAFAVPDTMVPLQDGWNFGFAFRLAQVSAHTTDRSWLISAAADPRAAMFPAAGLTPFDLTKGLDPAQYFGTTATATGQDHFLLFRSMGGSSNISVSANNDAPLFELPRQPILNLAELQHLQTADARPFAAGNSWAPTLPGGENMNVLFDRYFVSGLGLSGSHPNISAAEPLPNFHLQAIDIRSNPSSPLGLADLQASGRLSAQYLLMRGSFNLNSTSAAAWQAVMSSLRFADSGWARADVDNSTTPSATLGTQVATNPGTVTETFRDGALDSSGFAVFRFPQTAQETFAAAALANPNAPSRVPFRRGVRGGDDAGGIPGFGANRINALATEISTRIRAHLTGFGPYRSLEEFLGPSSEFGGRSLLEDAILAAGLNPDGLLPGSPVGSANYSGLSSLTITQADLLGIIGPFLQTRSDTFLIRTYGESVNPATGRTGARAWCEALVQRLPAPFDPADNVVQPSGALGRRFQVVSLRWLGPDDI